MLELEVLNQSLGCLGGNSAKSLLHLLACHPQSLTHKMDFLSKWQVSKQHFM